MFGKLLKLNAETLRHFHFALPPNTLANAAALAPYATAIPRNYLRSAPTFQPLPSHLNYQIATGQVKVLPHHFYETAVYVKSDEDGWKLVQHVMEWIKKRGGAGELRLAEIWRRGVQKLEGLGGWRGAMKRIFAYLGLAGGFNHIPSTGVVNIRLEAHFVGLNAAADKLSFHSLVLQAIHTAPVDVEIYCSFITDASSLPSHFTDGDVSLLEAFLSLGRRTDIFLGGGNLIGCGRFSLPEVIQSFLGRVSPAATLAALETSTDVPSSLYTTLIRRNEPTDTVAAILANQAKSHEVKKKKTKKERLAHSRFEKGPPRQVREFWREAAEPGDEDESDGSIDELDLGGGGGGSDEESEEESEESEEEGEEDDTTLKSTRKRKKELRSIRYAISQLSEAKQATLKPFVHSTFILPLLKSISTHPNSPVFTSQTIRQGVDVTFVKGGPSQLNYRFILAHGTTVLRAMSCITLNEVVDTARLRWKHGVLTATKADGEPVQVRKWGGNVDDWCWDEAEVVKRTRKGPKKVGKQARQKLMRRILEG